MNREKWNWEFLKNGLWKRNSLVLLLLVGILLVVVAVPSSEEGLPGAEEQTERQTAEGKEMGQKQYETYLERRLEKVLADVEGVGRVRVMITLQTSAKREVEKDVERTGEEYRETTVAKEDGGSRTPYVSREVLPEIAGVVVSATGGDNAFVRKEITEAVQALFGIDTHKIKIMKQNDEKKEDSF